MNSYHTINNLSEGIYKEKGSKFIAYAYPVRTLDEIKEITKELKKKYYDARHICFAYALEPDGSVYRANDDGEPSGTAGKPIHGVLLTNNLTYTLIAVVRYFGGVKLGTSGLIHAYREAAADAIANNEIIEKTVDIYFAFTFEYPMMNDVMRIVKEEECELIEQNFELTCYIKLRIRKARAEVVESRLHKVEGLVIQEDENEN